MTKETAKQLGYPIMPNTVLSLCGNRQEYQ